MIRLTTRWAWLAMLAATLEAQASGFYFGDNGSKALAQGGAITGQADDLTAMQHNPAGLAQLDAVNVLVDGDFLNHEVTFQRQDPGFDPNNPSTLLSATSNKAGIFIVPFGAASYGFKIGARTLTLGLGIWGPPAVGRYAYAEPNYEKDAAGKYLANPIKASPNRYALINNDILIAYPTLTAAIDVHPRVMVGVSLQLVLSHFMFRQALYSGVTTPAKAREEDPIFDSVVKADLVGRPGVTGILGVLVKPTDQLAFGASLRPAIPITSDGTLDISLGEAAKGLGAAVSGNKATLQITMPLELRVGGMYRPIEKLRLLADFVYQGWDSLDAERLTPRGMTLTLGSGAPQDVPAFKLQKNWVATWSARVGASYDLMPLLTVHAGGWYETSAMPAAYYNIDFANPARFIVTTGLSLHLPHLDVVLSGALTPAQTTAITTSDVRQGQTDSTIPGSVVGDGLYTSGGWVISAGLHGHFGQTKEAARAEPAPTPTPTPAPASSPVTP